MAPARTLLVTVGLAALATGGLVAGNADPIDVSTTVSVAGGTVGADWSAYVDYYRYLGCSDQDIYRIPWYQSTYGIADADSLSVCYVARWAGRPLWTAFADFVGPCHRSVDSLMLLYGMPLRTIYVDLGRDEPCPWRYRRAYSWYWQDRWSDAYLTNAECGDLIALRISRTYWNCPPHVFFAQLPTYGTPIVTLGCQRSWWHGGFADGRPVVVVPGPFVVADAAAGGTLPSTGTPVAAPRAAFAPGIAQERVRPGSTMAQPASPTAPMSGRSTGAPVPGALTSASPLVTGPAPERVPVPARRPVSAAPAPAASHVAQPPVRSMPVPKDSTTPAQQPPVRGTPAPVRGTPPIERSQAPRAMPQPARPQNAQPQIERGSIAPWSGRVQAPRPSEPRTTATMPARIQAAPQERVAPPAIHRQAPASRPDDAHRSP